MRWVRRRAINTARSTNPAGAWADQPSLSRCMYRKLLVMYRGWPGFFAAITAFAASIAASALCACVDPASPRKYGNKLLFAGLPNVTCQFDNARDVSTGVICTKSVTKATAACFAVSLAAGAKCCASLSIRLARCINVAIYLLPGFGIFLRKFSMWASSICRIK